MFRTQDERMASITQTQMNLKENCPRSWIYYRKKVPQVEGDKRYALAGTIVHESIEQYFKTISDNPHSGLITGTFNDILNRNWEPHKEVLRELTNRKTKCAENFIKLETNRVKSCTRYRPTYLEEKMNANIDGIEYFCIVDSFWADDGILIDWKTGQKVTLDVSDYIQGTLEKMILESRGLKVQKVFFVMLLTGQIMEMTQQPNSFIHDRAIDMIKCWKTGIFTKKKGQKCNYCGWNLRCSLEEQNKCLWRL
jgi:hypothetical protein